MIVAFVTVYEDPIVGILLGTALSLIIFVHKLSDGQFEVGINDNKNRYKTVISKEDEIKLEEEDHTLVYTIKGQLVYVNSNAHIERFDKKLMGIENLILRLRELYFIDLDGVEAIEEILEICKKRNINVYITGVSPIVNEMCKNSKEYRRIESEGKVMAKTNDVLKILGFELTNQPVIA
ncbi:MAG: STAS domain-containing protein [bacterium]